MVMHSSQLVMSFLYLHTWYLQVPKGQYLALTMVFFILKSNKRKSNRIAWIFKPNYTRSFQSKGIVSVLCLKEAMQIPNVNTPLQPQSGLPSTVPIVVGSCSVKMAVFKVIWDPAILLRYTVAEHVGGDGTAPGPETGNCTTLFLILLQRHSTEEANLHEWMTFPERGY